MQPRTNKIALLCTRYYSPTLVKKAEAAGFAIDCISFIETESIISPDLTQQIMNLVTEPATVAFTSSNAVSTIANCIKNLVPRWNVGCISGKTQQFVRKFFSESTILASENSAIILAQRLIYLKSIKEVIFFCGDQRLPHLPDLLSAANIPVTEIIVYKTLQTAKQITKHYDGIFFFSPSAAHSFFSVNEITPNQVLFSTGATTTAALQGYATNKIITATSPSAENLLFCATDYFNSITKKH